MAYTDIDDPTAYFQTKIYTGSDNGALTQVVTNDGNSDLQPDWIWIKRRNGSANHSITDTVRGLTIGLSTSTNAAEVDDDFGVTAVGSDGFSVRENTSAQGQVNTGTLVAWQWKAETAFSNDASSTSVGTIDSAGSASTASGFSIVSWTGTGSAGTIAHGLNKLPKMIIAKQRNTARNWVVYFLDTSIANNNVNNYLELDTTAASTGDSGGRWGAYANYSTNTFGVGTDNGTNVSGGTYIAYVFSDIQAYSKIGKYVGDGNADGTFIYTGFKPAFVISKKNSGTSNWVMFDNKRDVDNVCHHSLYANLSNAETTSDAKDIDMLSNGFKFRTAESEVNGSGESYIYMAFAENPFVTSTGVPATAR